ncbi:MAG: CHASE sensor domain-containing protein, partial [Planctomycetota bacterium]
MAAAGQSINRRLTQAIVFTTTASLLVACAAIVLYDRSTFRDAMLGRAETLSEVVAINSAAALGFYDPETAAQTLSALSAAEPVIAAVIYDELGAEFARYERTGASFTVPSVREPGEDFASAHLDLYRPIALEGERIGTILVRWDSGAL